MSDRKLLELATMAAPDMIEKTAEALVELEQEAPEFLGEVISDFNVITGTATDGLEKTAALGGDAKTWAIAVGGSLAAGLGTAIASDLYDAARRGLTKGRNFNRIMEANPDLKQNFDPKRLQMAYNTVHRFAPEFTADPLAGGSLLRQMAVLDGSEHTLTKDLTGMRKNVIDSTRRQFTPGLPLQVKDNSVEQAKLQLERDKLLDSQAGRKDARDLAAAKLRAARIGRDTEHLRGANEITRQQGQASRHRDAMELEDHRYTYRKDLQNGRG